MNGGVGVGEVTRERGNGSVEIVDGSHDFGLQVVDRVENAGPW